MTTYLGSGYRWRYRLKYIVNPMNYYRELKKHADRLKYGVNAPDIWNFDIHFSKMMVRVTQELKEWSISYPPTLETWDDWVAILDEMQLGFQAYLDAVDDFEEGWAERERNASALLERSLDLFKEYFHGIND
jgi:hypothetical protein